MKPWLRFVFFALLAVLVAELYVRQRERPTSPGRPAPEFSLLDTDGRRVALSSFRGRVVAVNFWATWCGPCRQEVPVLVRLYSENEGKCFELLGVASESGTRDQVVAAAHKLGINYPVLLDDEGKAGDAYRIPGYPRTFLIDAGGQIRTVFEGAVERADIERALAPLLAEAPASCGRA
jgi:cytochrome c biogenesis protein CcmG, thiol:disulfide interchange protein DsbE